MSSKHILHVLTGLGDTRVFLECVLDGFVGEARHVTYMINGELVVEGSNNEVSNHDLVTSNLGPLFFDHSFLNEIKEFLEATSRPLVNVLNNSFHISLGKHTGNGDEPS